MHILAINTASSKTAIAVLNEQKILAEKSWISKNNEAEKLMPAIDELLKKAKTNYQKLDKIFVVRGPGSFTGLRVGVTVANTIAFLTNAQLYSINSFELWHLASDLPVLIYAGSGGVYFSKNVTQNPKLLNIDEAKKLNLKEVTGDITTEQIEILKLKFKKTRLTFGKIIQKTLNTKIAQHHSNKVVEPFYIKEPGITQRKK